MLQEMLQKMKCYKKWKKIYLQEKKKIYLIDISTSIKMRHLRSKIHLSKKGRAILEVVFVKHVSDIFSWQVNKYKRNKNFSEEHKVNFNSYSEHLVYITVQS